MDFLPIGFALASNALTNIVTVKRVSFARRNLKNPTLVVTRCTSSFAFAEQDKHGIFVPLGTAHISTPRKICPTNDDVDDGGPLIATLREAGQLGSYP